VTAWLIATPRLPGVLGGVGDAFAALFLAHHLRGANLETALEGAVSSIFAALEASAEANAKELALVAAQDAIVDPARRFVTDRIA
jgi:pyridoxine kinase